MQAAEVAWRNKAACRPRVGATVEEIRMVSSWFFDGAPHYTEARNMCRDCVVRWPCLKWAVDFDDRQIDVDRLDGMFGGATKNERAALAQKWREGD